jgi:two-component SAPR family response regulator
MITCAIVEDAEKDIKVLKNTVQGDNRFSLYTHTINAENWTEVMSANKFDLLFVDVELGKHNVFELLKKLAYKPVVVVISNYPKYATQAYEYDVVHYIQKPIKADTL